MGEARMLPAVAAASPATIRCDGAYPSPKPPNTMETRMSKPVRRAYRWIESLERSVAGIKGVGGEECCPIGNRYEAVPRWFQPVYQADHEVDSARRWNGEEAAAIGCG